MTFPVKVLACASDELSVIHQGERDLTSSCENTMNCAVLGTAAGYTYVVKTKRLSASLVTCLCLYFCDGWALNACSSTSQIHTHIQLVLKMLLQQAGVHEINIVEAVKVYLESTKSTWTTGKIECIGVNSLSRGGGERETKTRKGMRVRVRVRVGEGEREEQGCIIWHIKIPEKKPCVKNSMV